MHGNPTELREGIGQMIPDPDRHVLASRRFESLDVIQVSVVESVVHWRECPRDFIEIDDPAMLLVELSFHEYLDLPGVAV